MRKVAIALCLFIGAMALPQSGAEAVDFQTTANAFSQLASNSNLADPAVVVMDQSTGEVVFANEADAPRKPASVIKLLAATSAYSYLSASDSFTTSLWSGIDSQSVVIQGSFDPWIGYDDKVAKRMHRTSMGQIQWNAFNTLLLNNGSFDKTTIYYSNLYPEDVAELTKYGKFKGAKTSFVRISSAAAAAQSAQLITSSTSPTVETILNWTLTWSDNVLAERMARIASVAAGNTRDDIGISKTFKSLMAGLGISTAGAVIKDASGLSKQNRLTATQISQLLFAIAHNEKFAPILEGLAVGGVTGTLRHRFLEYAPEAVGLVKAKTGTLNGTTNLAGYVESGDHDYIFVIIADNHNKSYAVTKRVRATVDRILGKIAKPLLPVLPSVAPSSETMTITAD
jgi:serine-type D-Ala-D-Ala carboxypeptidase/endopeptidase (penicillin-binding protein 4)